MSEAIVKLDMREFNKALQEYVDVSGKDYAEAANRQLNNLCIQGIKLQRKADASLIKAIPKTMEWWPKLVAKVLVGRKHAQIAAKGKSVKIRFKGGKSRLKGRYYSIAQARSASNRLIRARVTATTFLMGFFVACSKEITARINATAARGKQFEGIMTSFRPATAGMKLARAFVSALYQYKRRKGTTGQTADAILAATLTKAVSATVKDMRVYIERKMAERAKQFSAK